MRTSSKTLKMFWEMSSYWTKYIRDPIFSLKVQLYCKSNYLQLWPARMTLSLPFTGEYLQVRAVMMTKFSCRSCKFYSTKQQISILIRVFDNGTGAQTSRPFFHFKQIYEGLYLKHAFQTDDLHFLRITQHNTRLELLLYLPGSLLR